MSVAALAALAADQSRFAGADAELAASLRAALKQVHDEAVASGRRAASALGDAVRAVRPTPELLVDGVDRETVWQQLQGRSRAVERHAAAATVWLAEQRDRLLEEEEEEEDDEELEGEELEEEELEELEEDDDVEDEEEEDDEDDDEDEDEEDESDDDEAPAPAKAKKARKAEPAGGVTEDDFFSLAAMEAFVKEDEDLIAAGPGDDAAGDGDDDESDDDESEEDEEEDDDGDEGEMYGQDAKYDDFFDEADDYSGAEEEEDEAAAAPSRHDARAEKELSHIEELERENLQPADEKAWELRGEVGAGERPRNSLLGVDASWDGRKGGGAPPLDAAFSAAVEAAIRERVREERWDDIVAREVLESAYAERGAKDRARAAADDDDGELGKKAAVGLGEEYERDYVARREAAEGGDAAPKAPPRDDALDALWAKLSRKLDGLSHFAPAPEVPALDVLGAAKKTHAAAVSFEEATPGAVAAADGAAPEEVHAKKRGRDGLLMAPEEATREEKKAKRSAKKKARNAKRKKLRSDARVVARVDPGMGNPYEKEKLRKALAGDGAPAAAVDARGGDYGKSSKFFEQLQRDVSAAVRGGRADYAAPEPPKRKRAKRADAAKLG